MYQSFSHQKKGYLSCISYISFEPRVYQKKSLNPAKIKVRFAYKTQTPLVGIHQLCCCFVSKGYLFPSLKDNFTSKLCIRYRTKLQTFQNSTNYYVALLSLNSLYMFILLGLKFIFLGLEDGDFGGSGGKQCH